MLLLFWLVEVMNVTKLWSNLLAKLAGEWKSSFQTLLQTPGISKMYGQVKAAGLVDVSSGDGGVYPLLQAPLHHCIW